MSQHAVEKVPRPVTTGLDTSKYLGSTHKFRVKIDLTKKLSKLGYTDVFKLNLEPISESFTFIIFNQLKCEEFRQVRYSVT